MIKQPSILLLIIFGLILTLSQPLPAQVQKDGLPESFSLTEKSAAIIPVSSLDSIYPSKMILEDVKLGISNRCGIVQPIDIDIKKAGIQNKIKNEGTIWRYQLNSPDAYSMGINFKTFHLPADASLFIYNLDESKIAGAFTNINNKENSQLTLADFAGNVAIIEYFEPDSAEFQGDVVIGSVSLAYRDLAKVTQVRIGVNCSLGDEWQVEKHGICLMSFNDGFYSYYCSGSLVNNVREDGTPYFLTANHCISTNTEARTLVTYFNYENTTCSSNDASLGQSLSGASLKASYSASDFSLLLLSEYPPANYKAYFAGWDATGINPESGVCIHHPEGTPKCISFDNDKVYDNDIRISWDDRSISEKYSHWDVSFDEGNIEDGSSGSPLFDQNKRIVGQLHGGDTLETFFGKISVSWETSSNSAKQLKAWLDPDNSGIKILDGIGAQTSPKAKFLSTMTMACTNNPVQLIDKSLYSPKKWLWRISPNTLQFVENTDSTSQNPVVEFLDENRYTVELIASNNFGSDSSIAINYIDAKSTLQVGFSFDNKDTTICGCDLENFQLVALGAYQYQFGISETNYLNAESHSDTLLLYLDETSVNAGSFTTWVKVTGTHGSCMATDSILLHIVQQVNDNVSNATNLHLGRNSSFSNKCGSVEPNELSPYSGNCYSQVSWCANESGISGNLNNSIWFSFYGPSSGAISIDTHGFDDQIAIYKTTSKTGEFTGFDNLEQVAANDNRSSSDVTAYIRDLEVDAGVKYWVQLDGRNGDYGDAVIDLISSSVEVYPTVSATGLFDLYISNPEEGMANYSVYSCTGQKIIGGSVDVTVESNDVKLDLSFCPRGVYLLSVKMGGTTSSKKLIIR